MKIDSQSSLFVKNRIWLMSAEVAEGRFVKYEYLGVSKKLKDNVEVKAKTSTLMEKIGSPAQGKISGERVFPGRIDLKVECQEAATLILKMTYHPNWHVTIDGREVQTFMVSPSFIGFEVPAGNHHVRAEYRSPIYKTLLLIFGACIIVATVWFRHLFGRLETLISSKH
jgi:hypothetical protein